MGIQIKVLGAGCARCSALEKITQKAVDELGIAADIEKTGDIDEILSYGVMRTPGLVINGKLVISGEVPSILEIKSMLYNLKQQEDG